MKYDIVSISIGLLALHWGALLFSAWKWPFRSMGWSNPIQTLILTLLSVVAWLIVLGCLFVFLDWEYQMEGNGASWFLIYSMFTLGGLPALTLVCHVFAGRSWDIGCKIDTTALILCAPIVLPVSDTEADNKRMHASRAMLVTDSLENVESLPRYTGR